MSIELRAVGLDNDQITQITLSDNVSVRVGRSSQADMVVAWDERISREHADLKWDSNGLQVRCLGHASNPLIVQGEPVRELTIDVGGEFMIGQTSFQLIEKTGNSSPPEHTGHATILSSQTYDAQELNDFQFSDPVGQMEMLARLPGLISNSASDDVLAGLIVDILMDTIPASVAVAVMRYDNLHTDDNADPFQGEFDPARPVMMRVASEQGYKGRFRPSRRMIRSSLETGKSVLHIWDCDSGDGQFTLSGGLDWAFCTPVQTAEAKQWCLYVAGQGSASQGILIDDDTLKGDMRFVELVAQFIGSICNVRLLEEQKTQLSSFFSPLVIDSLLGQQSQTLKPAQQDIAVLFCDVRGFSHLAELFQDDLFQLLATGKRGLGLMTNSILENDGAIADFQGDAALGFWGWPVSLKDGPVPACRAALKIVETFNNSGDHSLAGVSVGIGIAHGNAIAGEIGTDKQAKIGVFGPVVNQCSRFEGLTKQLGVSICIDKTTAEYVQLAMPESEARCRRLVRIRPAGMETPLTVFQLLPGTLISETTSDRMLSKYDAGLSAILDGDWTNAVDLLKEFRITDGPTRFLMEQMQRTDFRPPDGWDGAFSLSKK